MTQEFIDKRSNRQIEGQPGDRMQNNRASRERSMQALALRPDFMAQRLKHALEKQGKRFDLENLAAMLGTSEYAAWLTALEQTPTTERTIRDAEYRAKLLPGILKRFIKGA